MEPSSDDESLAQTAAAKTLQQFDANSICNGNNDELLMAHHCNNCCQTRS
jgi:hypothetical protein